MKKRFLSLLLTCVLVLLTLCVPANAAQRSEKILYKALAIQDTELLLQRAKLGIDERSPAAKQAVKITTSSMAKSFGDDVYQTTQLLERKQLANQKMVESYLTTAMVGSYSKSDSDGDENVGVYVSIYWHVEQYDPYIPTYDVYADKTTHRYSSNGNYIAYNLNAWQHQAVHTGGYAETVERTYGDPVNNQTYTLYPPISDQLTADGGVGAGTELYTNHGTYTVELAFVVEDDVFG